MKHRRFGRFVAAAVVLGGASSVPAMRVNAAQAILLRSHFVVGQSFTELQTVDSIQKISFVIGTGKLAQKESSNDVEHDSFLATATVVKVYKDGSAQWKITFGPSSVVKNGKTVKSSMAGFYRLMHVDTTFHQLSSQDFGAKALPSIIAGALPDTQPTPYPLSALSVGGNWTRTEKQSGLGTLTETITLVALGSHAGRQTATLHAVINQNAKLSTSGMSFDGHVSGGSDNQILVDTQQDIVPMKASLLFSGKISGTASGLPVKGTFSFSFKGVSTPQS